MKNMTKEEAIKIIEILLEADGGCKYCALALIELFCKKFSEYEELAKELFRERFKCELAGNSKRRLKHE